MVLRDRKKKCSTDKLVEDFLQLWWMFSFDIQEANFIYFNVTDGDIFLHFKTFEQFA